MRAQADVGFFRKACGDPPRPSGPAQADQEHAPDPHGKRLRLKLGRLVCLGKGAPKTRPSCPEFQGQVTSYRTDATPVEHSTGPSKQPQPQSVTPQVPRRLPRRGRLFILENPQPRDPATGQRDVTRASPLRGREVPAPTCPVLDQKLFKTRSSHEKSIRPIQTVGFPPSQPKMGHSRQRVQDSRA